MPMLIKLAFAAPVPRGYDVLVVTFAGADRMETVVLDRTTSTLYCSDRMFDVVQQYPEHAIADPVAIIGTSRAVGTRLLVEPRTAQAPCR